VCRLGTFAFLAVASVIALTNAGAYAAETPPHHTARSVATLISDTDAVAASQSLHLALRLQLAPGWHTYWVNPGDAGVAPAIDVSVTGGGAAGPIQWPVPARLEEGTLTAYAYTGDVVLPFLFTPGTGDQSLTAHAEWLVCRDVCVPESADFTLDLPAGTPRPSAQAPLIDGALATAPRPAPFATTIAADGTLALGAGAPTEIASAEFFPASPNTVEHAAVITPRIDGGRQTLRLDPLVTPADPAAADGVLVLKTAAGGVSAFDIKPTLAVAVTPSPRLLPLALLAIAGGLLLNLMPCVFPVLAMKALALSRLAQAGLREIRYEAGMYTAGVVLSFTTLGAVFLMLRSAGGLTGWGFQFQSPGFVTAIAWLLFAVGLSLSGVFSVGGSLMGRGNALVRRGGRAGSFLTGVLAVVVATPCTAPFMGAAIAGALTLPALPALVIFAALGLGLALPYAAVAIFPRLALLLPRPGQWMRTLQQVLAFPMYAAVLWLVWVVSQQSGPNGVLVAGGGLIAVGLAAWAMGLAHLVSSRGAALARAVAAVSVASLVALLTVGTGASAREGVEPFSTARLDELRSEGRPVFVDMTAAWCLSCLVNERVALSPPAVREAFANGHVAYLKGDWTSQNPAISAYLHDLGRDGVPLYVLYPPGKTPVVLPQILTQGEVLGELAKLSS
jgi:thiol:disulfide interchange protein DsbD